MDWLDFVLKFSGELLVVFLGTLVIGMNVMFFWDKNAYADNSLAAKFLSYHTNLNPKLYAKNNSIVTTITKSGGLFLEAHADEPESINAQVGEISDSSESSQTSIDEQGLSKPNPDSVKDLIAKQIKIYETKDTDTLKSIASENGVSVQTLLWANNLSSEKIKAGWFLKIPPVDGIIYTAGPNDTIPDLEKKFGVSQERIISYNSLENAEDIEAGQVFILPGGTIPKPKIVPVPKKPSTSSRAVANRNRRDGKVRAEGVEKPSVEEIDNGTGHAFPWGYCTWYVATRTHVPWGGNAKSWLANAKAYGSVISKKPIVGAIVVTTDSRRFGHVAYVENVDDDGFTVSEMNFEQFGKVNMRYIPNNSRVIRGFIYP